MSGGWHGHCPSPGALGSGTCSSCSSRVPRSRSARSPSRAWQVTSPWYLSSDSSVVRSMIWGSRDSVWARLEGVLPSHSHPESWLLLLGVHTSTEQSPHRKPRLLSCAHCLL